MNRITAIARATSVFGVALVSGAAVAFIMNHNPSPVTLQSPTPTAATPVPRSYIGETIDTPAEAITYSRALFPVEPHSGSEIVRLISKETWHEWTTGIPGARDGEGFDTEPVWIVGLLASGLMLSDVMPVEIEPGADHAIVGVVYAWDAREGHVLSTGPITNGTPWPNRTASSISALVNESIPIVPITGTPPSDS